MTAMPMTLLAYFPSPPQGVWHLGPVPIRAYALCIIIGILVALLLGDRRWEARGGERGVIYDIALWAVPFGLVGGRLYHLITDWETYFGEGGAGLDAALRIWDGGLGIWGAVAVGGLGAWIGCRRRGIPLPAFGDAIAPGIVLAQAIGRLGNYFNQELFGRETTLPWGMEVFYRRDPSGIVDVHSLDGVSTGQVALVVQPTFLYELLWNVLVFAILIYVDRRFKIGHGRLFALYVAGYCVGRFCIELLRDDVATHIAGIRINSFTSTFVFIGAVVYIILAPKGRDDPATLGGTRTGTDELPAQEKATELVSVASTTSAVAPAAIAESGEREAEFEQASEEPGEAAEDVEPQPEQTGDAESADAEAEPEGEAETGEVAESNEVREDSEQEQEQVEDAESPATEFEGQAAVAESEEREAEPGEAAEDVEPQPEQTGDAESADAEAEPEGEAKTGEVAESNEVREDSESEPQQEREQEREQEQAEDAESADGEDADSDATEATESDQAEGVADGEVFDEPTAEPEVEESHNDTSDETESVAETAASEELADETQAAPATTPRRLRGRWWNRTKRDRQ